MKKAELPVSSYTSSAAPEHSSTRQLTMSTSTHTPRAPTKRRTTVYLDTMEAGEYPTPISADSYVTVASPVEQVGPQPKLGIVATLHHIPSAVARFFRAKVGAGASASVEKMGPRLEPPSTGNIVSSAASCLPDTNIRQSLFVRPDEVGPIPGTMASFLFILRSFWNLSFLLALVSWILNWAVKPKQDWTYIAIFISGSIAILGLAKRLAFATDQLSLRVGQGLAGLLNAILGNVVELIVAVLAVRRCELGIVQSSLLGSVFSNLTAVLGASFFAGGIKFSEQRFPADLAQLDIGLLLLSLFAIFIPTAYNWGRSSNEGTNDVAMTQAKILNLSRGFSILMLLNYFCYLCYQLVSHKEKYQDDSMDNTNTPAENIPRTEEPESDQESERPQIDGWACCVLLLFSIWSVGFTAEAVVGSINALTASGPLSKEFVGLILLPIIGNIAEHVSAITFARKNKLKLSLGIAVGSSVQISLFVLPLCIIIAWGLGKPLSLLFDTIELCCLAAGVFVAGFVTQSGKSTWMPGGILITLYAMAAYIFFVYPGRHQFAACN
ncbi:Sodium/calcium exchanger protein-domain-containing protein [Mycena vitilis]|nr:Sodium/calcium exchanger protein-domain-containing protein [Mycena vitilis]